MIFRFQKFELGLECMGLHFLLQKKVLYQLKKGVSLY